MSSLTLIEKLQEISNNNTNLSSANMDFNALLTLAAADNNTDFDQQSFPDFSNVSSKIASALRELITTEQKWYFGYYTRLTIDRNNHQGLSNMLLAMLSSSIVTADSSKQAAIIEQLINNKLYDQKEVYQAALQAVLSQFPYKQSTTTSIVQCILHSHNLTMTQQRELLAGNLDGRLSLNLKDFTKLIDIVNNQETEGFTKLEIANILHSSINLSNTEKTELLAKLYPQQQRNLLTKFDTLLQQQEQSERIAIFVKNSIIKTIVSNMPDINFEDLEEGKELLKVKYQHGRNLAEYLEYFGNSINYDFENKKFSFKDFEELEINEEYLLDFLNSGVEKELKSKYWYTEDENQLTKVIGAVDDFLGTNFLEQKQRKETKGIFSNIKQYFIDMLISVENYSGYNFLTTKKSNILQDFNQASIELAEQIILELATTKDNEINYNDYKKLIESNLAKIFENYDQQEQTLKQALKKSHPDHNKGSSKEQYYANKAKYDYFKIMHKSHRALIEQLIKFHSYEKFLTVKKQKLTKDNNQLVVIDEIKPASSVQVITWLLENGLKNIQMPLGNQIIADPVQYLFDRAFPGIDFDDDKTSNHKLTNCYNLAHSNYKLDVADSMNLAWFMRYFKEKLASNDSVSSSYQTLWKEYNFKLTNINIHNAINKLKSDSVNQDDISEVNTNNTLTLINSLPESQKNSLKTKYLAELDTARAKLSIKYNINNKKEASIDEVTIWLLKDGLDKLQLPKHKLSNPNDYLFKNALHCYKYNDEQLAEYYKAAHPSEDVDPSGLSWMLSWFKREFNDNQSHAESGVYKDILKLYREKLIEIEQHNNKFDLKNTVKRYS